MRFPEETRAAIRQAGPHPTTITWPAGLVPEVGRLYWVQSAEDQEAERKRRAYSPETCAEVLAEMKPKPTKTKDEIEAEREERERQIAWEMETVLRDDFNGDRRQEKNADEIARARLGERPKRRRNVRAPLAGSDRICVLDRNVLDQGWEAKVVVHVDPDPVRHLRMRAKVPAGVDPLDGTDAPTETEPEQLPPERNRLEEEEALRIAHKASVDHSFVLKAEQHLRNQRRKGRPSKLAEEAVEKAKKRAALDSAA